MNWFCLVCGNETLHKRGRKSLWCSFCARLSRVNDWDQQWGSITMIWYEAEAKRLRAGRKMPDAYTLPALREANSVSNRTI